MRYIRIKKKILLNAGEGIYIPKGTEALIAITSIHRNPEVWSNPDKFDPDNFTPEAIQKRHPYAYVPFSAGPRNCIGMEK